MASAEPSLQRDGACLRLGGRLDRAAATALWARAQSSLDGVDTLDLAQVSALDSAGLALLAELSARIAATSGRRPRLAGNPPGLEELRAAYRLDPGLDPAGALP